MVRLAKLLMHFLTAERGMDEKIVAEALWHDYQRGNRPDVPGFLKKFGFDPTTEDTSHSNALLPRQGRHIQD